MIRKTKCKRKLKYAALHFVRLLESALVVLTLGTYDADFYVALLFSEWADDIDNQKSPLPEKF